MPAPASSGGAAPASLGGIAFSDTAIIAKNAAGTSAGISATPAGDTTNYRYLGSIDSYNSVAFYSGNSAPFPTLFGNTLNAVPALGFNGDQSGALTNAYVTFTGPSFDKIVLASSGNSFEFDNISYGSNLYNVGTGAGAVDLGHDAPGLRRYWLRISSPPIQARRRGSLSSGRLDLR